MASTRRRICTGLVPFPRYFSQDLRLLINPIETQHALKKIIVQGGFRPGDSHQHKRGNNSRGGWTLVMFLSHRKPWWEERILKAAQKREFSEKSNLVNRNLCRSDIVIGIIWQRECTENNGCIGFWFEMRDVGILEGKFYEYCLGSRDAKMLPYSDPRSL